MLSAGEIVSLTVEKPAAGGRMIARRDGQVVLVSGAIPGEQVTARVERTGRGVVYAAVLRVDVPSPDRRPVAADPSCGGCAYAHVSYARQLTVKAQVIADALTRIGHLPLNDPVPIAASPEEGYRMRARLHVRGGQIGFFREGTHELCNPRDTRQLRADTCDVLDRLSAGLRSLGMAGVQEIEVSENISANQRVAHLDVAVPIAARAFAALGASDGLTGLTVSGARGASGRAAVVSGDPHVVDVVNVGGTTMRLRRHVLAFFQGNRFLLSQLLSHVVSQIESGASVLDLYAGTGLFSVAAAAARGARVTAIEGDAVSAADLQTNAQSAAGQITAIHESVETYLHRSAEAPATLIVDPPRTGMSAPALKGAIELAAKSVIYVSCDVATLARDARRLVDSGYVLDRVAGFDLFPNTPHVESVATFTRV